MSSKEDVTVRNAVEADLDRVAELWAEMIELHHGLDDRFWRRKPDGNEIFRQWMAEALGDEKCVLVVAEVDGAVAGFVHGSLVNAPPPVEEKISGNITDVSVGYDYRGKGIGSKLLDELEKSIKQKGGRQVTLNAREIAVGFYEDHGYEIVAKAHTLYGCIEHFKMRKSLGSGAL